MARPPSTTTETLKSSPVLNAIFEKIEGKSPYKSPTDMGVNMAGYCISDDAATRDASLNEIIRRYFSALCDHKKGSDRRRGADEDREPDEPGGSH